MKRALIFGISGQDGSYLAEFLLEKGYEVHGMVRRVALQDQEARLWRIRHIKDRLTLHAGDILLAGDVFRAVDEAYPGECYHLAAQSDVGLSFKAPHNTLATNVLGTVNVLDALRDIVPQCRFYFAGSSEMFGAVTETPQTEDTPFRPRSPYGTSKVAGFDLARNYREAYQMFACSGILFNHESPRRGKEFVTRKITSTVAAIKRGETDELVLGNLEARRDWGYSGDYVRAMWMMLQQSVPEDFVVATDRTASVHDFARMAFSELDLDADDYLRTDDSFKRPAEVHQLCGDATKAHRVLGWEPKVSLEALVEMMVKADMERGG